MNIKSFHFPEQLRPVIERIKDMANAFGSSESGVVCEALEDWVNKHWFEYATQVLQEKQKEREKLSIKIDRLTIEYRQEIELLDTQLDMLKEEISLREQEIKNLKEVEGFIEGEISIENTLLKKQDGLEKVRIRKNKIERVSKEKIKEKEFEIKKLQNKLKELGFEIEKFKEEKRVLEKRKDWKQRDSEVIKKIKDIIFEEYEDVIFEEYEDQAVGWVRDIHWDNLLEEAKEELAKEDYLLDSEPWKDE